MTVVDQAAPWLHERIAKAESIVALPWVQSWQAQNANAFLQQGLPTRKDEAWKYTRVQGWLQQSFIVNNDDAKSVVKSKRLNAAQKLDAHRIFISNGTYQQTLSSTQDLPAGIIVLPLAEALTHYADKLQPLLQANQTATQFGALNAALLSQGVFVYIEANACIKKPLHIICHNSEQTMPLMMHARNIVIAEPNSEITLVEEYVGDNKARYFNNIVTQIVARAGAHVYLYKLQQESPLACHIANIEVDQLRDSMVGVYQVALGAALSRDDVVVRLNEANAECTLNGLYHTRDKQHVDYHLRVDHLVGRCSSSQNYKGIMEDASRAVFNGKVIVKKDAQKTRALQSNKNLLLSSQAEIDSKPELEIYADDVVCSHGATIGQLDKEALFYLRARGITQATAEHILTCGFAADLLDQFHSRALREYIGERVTARFANHLCLGDCHE